MSIVVETGTGLSNAETYETVAAWRTYVAARGPASTATDDLVEQAMRRATAYLAGHYAGQWPGYKLNGRSQALDWPRTSVVDSSGYDVPSDSVPAEVIAAHSEATLREVASPGALVPDFLPADQKIKSEKIGQIEVVYAEPNVDNAGSNQPTYKLIDELLYPLLLSGGTGRTNWLMRA